MSQDRIQHHELKTWPPFFQHIWLGEKRFEIRRDDRMFRVGDVLRLREFNKRRQDDGYTGREILAEVTYIYSGSMMAAGYVCMQISVIEWHGGPLGQLGAAGSRKVEGS